MIISEKIRIKINIKNIIHYINIGYNVIVGDVIDIYSNELNKGSHVKIKVKCDVCGKERDNLMYKEYIRNLNSGGYYSCVGKCSSNKNRNTNMKKYGVEYVSQVDKFKEKAKNTCLEKYGVDNYFKSSIFKEDFKEIMINKYGVDNPSKSFDLQKKKKEIMNKKYGVDYYVLAKDFREKSEKTCMDNYGVSSPMMVKDFVKKGLINKGLDFETDEYKAFQNKVYYLTTKNKKELLEKWNGYDYYDDEFIKDNFNLYVLDRNYPTIDHILPLKEGYKNGILPEELAKIDNLCFTKRWINSKKHSKLNWHLITC